MLSCYLLVYHTVTVNSISSKKINNKKFFCLKEKKPTQANSRKNEDYLLQYTDCRIPRAGNGEQQVFCKLGPRMEIQELRVSISQRPCYLCKCLSPLVNFSSQEPEM